MKNIWPKFGWVKDYREAEPATLASPVDNVDRYLIDAFGGVHTMYGLYAPSTDVFSPDRLNAIQDVQETMVSRMPDNVPEIEFLNTSNGDYSQIVNEHRSLVHGIPIFDSIKKARCDRFMEMIRSGEMIPSVTHITLGTAPVVRDLKKGLSLRRPVISREEFENACTSLKTAEESMASLAARAGMKLLPLSGFDCGNYFYRLMNPGQAIDLGLPCRYDPESTPWLDSWLIDEIDTQPEDWENEGMVKWGAYYHSIVTLFGKPLTTRPRIMESLTTKLGFRQTRTILRVRKLDQIAEKDKLKDIVERADHVMSLPMNLLDQITSQTGRDRESGKNNVEASSRVAEANKLISILREGAEVLTEAQMTFHLWHKNPQELKERREKLLTRMADMGSARGYVERHGSVYSLFQSLPCAGGPMLEAKKYRSRAIADLIPMTRDFETYDKPVTILRSSTGGLIPYNIFDKSVASAPMVFISGVTGSGKSMLANHLLATNYLGDTRLLICDFGGSYDSLASAIGASVFRLDPSAPQALNPLQLYGVSVDENGVVEEPSPAIRGKIAASVAGMLTRESDPNGELPEKWSAAISATLEQCFSEGRTNRKQFVILTDWDNVLKRRGDLEDLRLRLRPYLKGNDWGQWFDAPSSWKTDDRSFVIDMRGIRTLKVLSRALVPLAVGLLYDLARQDRGRKKVLVFEEMWEHINNPMVLELIIDSFKTLRKEGAAVIGISQSIADLQFNPRASVAIKNAVQTWFLFDQGDDPNQRYIADTLELTSGEQDILKTLGSSVKVLGNGKAEIFKECLFVRGNGSNRESGRVRAQFDSEEYWLYTSDSDEHVIRKDAREACNDDLWLALRSASKEYPVGLNKKRANFL